MSHIRWDNSAIRDLFLNDEGLGEELKRISDEKADSASRSEMTRGQGNRPAQFGMHKAQNKQPYVAKLKKLKDTQVAVIIPSYKASANYTRKHNNIHW